MNEDNKVKKSEEEVEIVEIISSEPEIEEETSETIQINPKVSCLVDCTTWSGYNAGGSGCRLTVSPTGSSAN